MSDEIKDILKKYHDMLMSEMKAIREENKMIQDGSKREFNSIKNNLDTQLKAINLMKKTLDEQTTKLDELVGR